MLRKRKLVFIVVAAMLVLAALACGSSTPATSEPPPAQPQDSGSTGQEQPAEESGPPPANVGGSKNSAAAQPPENYAFPLGISNSTNATMCYLYISPSTDTTWGEDWLGEYVLEPGYTYTVDLDYNTYDVQIQDCNGNVVEEYYEIAMGDQPYTWDITGSSGSGDTFNGTGGTGDAVFTIHNETNIDICWLWVSPSSNSDWGTEWFGNEFIMSPGYYFTETIYYDYYDILAADCYGNVVYEDYGVLLGDQSREIFIGR